VLEECEGGTPRAARSRLGCRWPKHRAAIAPAPKTPLVEPIERAKNASLAALPGEEIGLCPADAGSCDAGRFADVTGEFAMTNWILIPVVVAVLAAILLIWRAFAARPDRAAQRIGLWLAALFFTFYGPFSAVDPAWPPTAWAAAINAEKDFKDLWLAMIAMLVFSLANISDNLVRNYRDISTFSKVITPIVLVIYFIAIVLGMTRYRYFAEYQLTSEGFYTYWTIVWVGTALGAAWELLIALESSD
jgi:hypothetical protein